MRAALLAAALVAGWLAPAAAQAPIPAGVVREGTLSFDGKATAGDFTGITHEVRGSMTGGATMDEVRGYVEAPVNTLVTGNGKRDKDLNKSMESEQFPDIRFNLLAVTTHAARGDTTDATLQGNFVIHGETQAVELPAVIVHHPDGLTLTSTFPLNLKDYKIGGLSKFLGVLKMDEHIVVHVLVRFDFTPA